MSEGTNKRRKEGRFGRANMQARLYVHMSLCVYVCLSVCMYLCACMNVCMYLGVSVCMYDVYVCYYVSLRVLMHCHAVSM